MEKNFSQKEVGSTAFHLANTTDQMNG